MIEKGGKERYLIEMLIICGLCFLVFTLSAHSDALEKLVAFSREHEEWEIDELISVGLFLIFVLLFILARRLFEINKARAELFEKNRALTEALQQIKLLKEIIPICTSCKKIRDDEGYWHQVEAYIQEYTDSQFSHSFCPDCARELYPEYVDQIEGYAAKK